MPVSVDVTTATPVPTRTPARAPLSRHQVLATAVRYVDEHGLDALSMHKLGAELGVRAMSLYKYVASKDDLLDGIVEQLWDEIPAEPATGDWREAVRELARALRALVHRHPPAAPLLNSRPTPQRRPLWICHALLRIMRADGVPEQCAVALLRTVFPYGIGYALAELSFPRPAATSADATDSAVEEAVEEAVAQVALVRRFTNLLGTDAPDELVHTALLVCGDCDMSAQFDIGLDLMIRGLDAYLEGPQHEPRNGSTTP